MSTDYRCRDKIEFSALFDGRLAGHGITEHSTPDTTETHRCLTDGNNFLWAYGDDAGVCFTRYFPNGCPNRILEAIERVFDTVIYSEYDLQFWGFETEEEWAQWGQSIEKRSQDELYADMMRYVAGEPNGIRIGTVGESKAKIAKQLIEREPALAAPERKPELLKAVTEIYRRDHITRVKLSDQDLAVIKRMATHEEELPKA